MSKNIFAQKNASEIWTCKSLYRSGDGYNLGDCGLLGAHMSTIVPYSNSKKLIGKLDGIRIW